MEHAASRATRIGEQLAQARRREQRPADRNGARRARSRRPPRGAGAGARGDGRARAWSARPRNPSSRARGPSATPSAPSAHARARAARRRRPVWRRSRSSTPAARDYGDGARLILRRRRASRARWFGRGLSGSGRPLRAGRRGVARRTAPACRRRHARGCGGGFGARQRERAGRVRFLVARRRSRPGAGSAGRPEGVRPLTDVVRVSGPPPRRDPGGLDRAPGSRTTWRARGCAQSPCRARWRRSTATCSAAATSSRAVSVRNRAASLRPSARSRNCASVADSGDAEVDRLRQDGGGRRVIDRVDRDRHRVPAQRATPSGEGDRSGSSCRWRRAATAAERLGRKHEQVATERRRPKRSSRRQEARRDEARESIARIEIDQRDGRRPAERRATPPVRGARGDGGAGRAHGGSQGRARRACRARVGARRGRGSARRGRARARRAHRVAPRRPRANGDPPRASCADSISKPNAARRRLAPLRRNERAGQGRRRAGPALRGEFRPSGIAHPRGAPLARSRAQPKPRSLDVARATAEADLAHLATACVEPVQATLDEVAAEVARARA